MLLPLFYLIFILFSMTFGSKQVAKLFEELGIAKPMQQLEMDASGNLATVP